MDSHNTGQLREAVLALHMNLKSVNPLYFTDDLPEVEGGFQENEVPVYYGSTTLRDKMVAAGMPGFFFDHYRFSFMALRTGYGEDLLNYHSRVLTVGEFLGGSGNQNEDLFIRPADDSKTIIGGVKTRSEWSESIAISMNNTRGPTLETSIQIGEPYTLNYEWRLFIVGGRVVAASQYRAHGHLNTQPEVPEKVVEFGNRMAERYSPAEVFVMDICETGNRLYVLETNCFNCSGLYKASAVDIVSAVSGYLKGL